MNLKLKRTPGIYLIGFMGAGKSTIGRRLAQELGWTFADLDEDIEAAEGRSISEIFEQAGEPAFRAIESQALARRLHRIRAGTPTVLALGGGAFARDVNREQLRENGYSVWLDCPLETLWDRVSRASHRPLARDRAHFDELYLARREIYAQADFRVDACNDNPSVAVTAILDLPPFL
ncbi:MAG: shikimate kinase [Acidobacteria bacterium]|nr:shikimate kinase [Acidobacteriota bacterium]